MKNFTKFLTIAILGLVYTTSTFGQSVSTNATATATIVTPLGITAVQQLTFGNISVGTTPSDIRVTAAGAAVRSLVSGDAGLVATAAITAASFSVTGQATFTYAVTLPADGTVTIASGANTMAVKSFQASAMSGTVGGTFYVGATLTVGAPQAAGSYTGTFPVSVQYN